jgi:hypothetical protein
MRDRAVVSLRQQQTMALSLTSVLIRSIFLLESFLQWGDNSETGGHPGRRYGI